MFFLKKFRSFYNGTNVSRGLRSHQPVVQKILEKKNLVPNPLKIIAP
jgi:hypothetical protein